MTLALTQMAMTLIQKLDLDTVQMYHHTVYVLFQSYSLNRWTHRQTHRQRKNITRPLTREVKIVQLLFNPILPTWACFAQCHR